MSPHWLASWVQTLYAAAGFTPEQAIHQIPMSVGWQLIHSYLVSEGNARNWACASVGEVPDEVRDWRNRVTDYNPDIE